MTSSTVWVWEEDKRTFSQCKRVVLTARFQLPVNCTQYLAKDQSKSTAKKGREKRYCQFMDIKARQRMPLPFGDTGISWSDGEWGVILTNSIHPRESPVQAPAVGLLPFSGKHCPPLCEEGGSRSSMQSSESYEYQLKQSSGTQLQ